jgi:hypothetical protein
MSVANEPDMVGLHDPTHYPHPPRRLRESQPRPDDALREETPEAAGRGISHPAPRHSRSEKATSQSQHRPPEFRAKSEIRPLARPGTLFGGAGRLAAAIGFSAVVALLFVSMMPAARDDRQFSAAVEPFTAALSQQHQGEDPSRAALTEFQPLLAGDDTGQAAERVQTDMRQSDKILQQFLHWRQKANPSAAAQ